LPSADEPTITTTTTTTTKRTKSSHIGTQTRAPELPTKDPSKHTSARVRASYRGPPCDEDVTRNEENEKWFKYDQKNEAEVDAWLQEVLPRLEAGEKIPLRDIRDTDWGLFCPEYFSQYLGWDVWWLGSAPSMRIYFTKPSETDIPLQNSETTAEFLLNSTIAPKVVTILDFKRLGYTSLEPIELDLWRAGGLKLKLWFLGNDMLRLEMDTSYHTGKPGYLMISGKRRIGKMERS
jgi:hypothetical protein